MQLFDYNHTGKCNAICHVPSRPSPKSSQETPTATVEIPEKLDPAVVCTVECPMMRPLRCSTLQMPISDYPPKVGSEREALINVAIRTLGNDQVLQIVASFITTQDLPRLLPVNNHYSTAASSPTYLQKTNTTHHTSNCARNLAENQTTNGMCIPEQYRSRPNNVRINPEHTVSTHSLGIRPPAVAASGTFSALRRNSKSEKVENQNSGKQKISNSEYGTVVPNRNMITNAAHTAIQAPASAPSYAAAP